MIDHKNFQMRSDGIKTYMAELHQMFKSGQFPTDKQIVILGQKFYERDKEIDKPDLEMMHVIRGFEWGMRAMRQICEGNNLI